MRSFWHRWTSRNGEEISALVGLSFGALYLAAVAAVGTAAIHVQRAELTSQRLADAKQQIYWLSRYLAQVYTEEPEAVSREIRRAAREEGVASCALVSSNGTFTAHSDPTRIGQPAEEPTWIDSDPGGVLVARDPNRPNEYLLATRMVSAAGVATTDELRVGLAAVEIHWTQSQVFFWSGYVLLAVLGLFLLLYRLLRRAVQPLAVIRGRLVRFTEPTSERLTALRLNDSYDQISTSWNRLIQFISEMQERLRRNDLAADLSGAMDGYRSQRLTDILMQIPFGVLVVDAEQKISFLNRAAAGMLATGGETLENAPAEKVFEEPLRLALLSPHGRDRTSHASASRWTDHSFKRPHGEVVLRFWSVPSESGSNEHILFVQDVTQAKEAEQARDHFLYHVTHELRTPLTNIRAYAETLSQGVIDDEQTIRECYNVIMGETQRLSRLVEDILNVSQLEVGTARLNLSEVYLDQLLRKVVQDMQGSADAKNIDLLLDLPAKMPRVRGDKERLAVVLNNLIGNAIKYTPDGGRVDVRCQAESQRVRITVSDTGIGIEPADQEKIFEKFYRVDDERVSAVPGTGLGLAIAKETVRLHGGSIGVESTPDKGTTFTVILPALALDQSNGAREASPARSPSNVSTAEKA